MTADILERLDFMLISRRSDEDAIIRDARAEIVRLRGEVALAAGWHEESIAPAEAKGDAPAMPNGVVRELPAKWLARTPRHEDAQAAYRVCALELQAALRADDNAAGVRTASVPPAGDGMLPDALVPVADEWYRLCERRFAVDRIKISGELAKAIVEAVSAGSRTPQPAGGEAVAPFLWLRMGPDGTPDWSEDCCAEDKSFLDPELAREGYWLKPLYDAKPAGGEAVANPEHDGDTCYASDCYAGNSVGWWKSKAENYGAGLLKVCDALRRIGVKLDGATPCWEYVAKLHTTPPAAQVQQEAVGYQRIFDAIGAATRPAWAGAAIGVSVAEFLRALGTGAIYTHPSACELGTVRELPWDDDVRNILGRPNFSFIGNAQAQRAAGRQIPRKSEEEQAYCLHWLLNLYLKHGAGWMEAANAELAALRPSAEAALQHRGDSQEVGRG